MKNKKLVILISFLVLFTLMILGAALVYVLRQENTTDSVATLVGSAATSDKFSISESSEHGPYFTKLLADNCGKETIECGQNAIYPYFDYYMIEVEGASVYVYEKDNINVNMTSFSAMGGFIREAIAPDPYVGEDMSENISIYIGANQRWGPNTFGLPVTDFPMYIQVVREVRVSDSETIIISQMQPLIAAGDARVVSAFQPFSELGTETNFDKFVSIGGITEDYEEVLATAQAKYIGNQVLYYENHEEAEAALAKAMQDDPNFLSAEEKDTIRDAVKTIAELEL